MTTEQGQGQIEVTRFETHIGPDGEITVTVEGIAAEEKIAELRALLDDVWGQS